MNEKILNRASQRINVEDFCTLTRLHLEHEWLQYEPDALFELWCLSDNDDQKNLIEFLIKNFSYIDTRKLSEGCKLIASNIELSWSLLPNDTFLVATCDDRKPDGSQSLIQSLKNKFSINWKESNFYNSLPIGANEVPNGSNLILVDDFIGTGDTITRKINYVRSVFEKKGFSDVKIKIVSLAAMNFSKDTLNSLDTDYFSVHWLSKGINELIEEGERSSATQSMELLEKKLKKQYHGKTLPNFGYKRSESLFALETANVPNNVFPIFWWPFLKGGGARKTIFKRV